MSNRRLNLDLIQMGNDVLEKCLCKKVEENAPHMNNLLQLTRHLMNEVKNELPEPFDMTEKGCWMLWKNEKTADHEKHLADQANKYGLKTIMCTPQQVQDHEPQVETNVAGGVLYLLTIAM